MQEHQRRAAGHIMIRTDAKFWSDSTYRDTIYRQIDAGIAGIGVFLGELDTTAKMIGDIRERAGRRILVAADYEFGLPMRLEGGVAIPRAMALGRTTAEITRHMARLVAEEARALGVDWNFAPVCDINSNPRNPIVNTRAFGESPEIVSAHVTAWIEGSRQGGVLSSAKHAPGHGDTLTDSHVDLPLFGADEALAWEREFVPFLAAIRADVDSIMVGHLLVPFLDPEYPASCSHAVVSQLIRGKWGYHGVIITDAMDMGAITRRYDSATAARHAMLAGVDIVLMPENTDEAMVALATSISEREIDEEWLLTSEQRIDALFHRIESAPSRPLTIDQNSHAMMALKAADVAIEMRGTTDLLPISGAPFAVFAIVDEHEADAATTFFHYLSQATEDNCDFAFIDASISDSDLSAMALGTKHAERIIFAFFGKAVAFRGAIGNSEKIAEIMLKLSADRPTINLVCGSPYGPSDLAADLTITTFSDTVPSLAAVVLRLIGRRPAAD